MKKIKLFLFALASLVLTNCEVLDELDSANSSIVHFHIHSSSNVDYARITVNGVTKSVSQVGDIDACDGGNYAGLASFSSSGSSMGYVVKDLNGNELTSGTVALTAECIDYTFN
jgi:hypothetical protein